MAGRKSGRNDMAGFCAKCGVPLESSTAFCPTCGTPIASQPVPPLPAAAVKKTSVLKIVLIVVAVLFGLGILGVGTIAYMGWRAMHSGAISVGQESDVSEADLGVSIYPGAVPNAKAASRMKFSGMQSVSAMYSTGDPASAVLNYYQEKLGPNATSSDRNGTSVLTLSSAVGNTKDSVIVSVTPGAQAGGATQIMIMHMKTGTQ
jgi:hypothetical protein